MATPLIRSLRTNGGTIFVFNSASNDIAKTFSDDNFRFTFSKFAGLDLPKVTIPSYGENNISWQALGNRGATNSWKSSTVIGDMQNGDQKQNTHLSNSFQNYMLNLENVILNQTNSDGNLYDSSSYQSVTERLFWKWLTDIGAIRYNNAEVGVDSTVSNVFVEEEQNTADDINTNNYNTVVKYLGDISLINNINRGGEAYTEIHLHIPTEHGNTPTVLFSVLSDDNYKPSLDWYSSNGENIEGRTSPADPRMSVKGYFNDSTTDSYSTQNTFGNVTNTITRLATDVGYTNQYDVLLSNMDGATIDWDISKYQKIANNPSVQSMSGFNATAEAQNFDFNTVLIYYDIFDASDNTVVKRNLYGVLFLDDFKDTISDGAKLKTFSKYKPNSVTRLNGNAYSLKTNIKFDTSADNVGVERSLNEYSTFSMDLFSDALIQLQDATDSFLVHDSKISNMSSEIDNLKSFYYNQKTIDLLKSDISSLSELVQNSLIALESPTTLIELIRSNSQRINKLAGGELSTDLSYNLDPFTQSNGIKLDKSVPNKIIISNTVQGYNTFPICYNQSRDLVYTENNGVTNTTDTINYAIKNNILNLGLYTNYYKNTSEQATLINNDVIINIDDTTHKFKTGQVFRIVFDNSFSLSETKNLYIYTDAENNKQTGKYKWLIDSLVSTDFISEKPIIEIVCVNASLYEFSVDILR